MILCHRFKFIFVKTHKTAGTSIEIALSQFCGNEDVITPISSQDEEIRSQLGYHGPRNYFLPADGKAKDASTSLPSANGTWRFFNHISARRIRERVGLEVWNSYFKFCFVRNPWDQVISQYHYLYPSDPRPSLSDCIMSPNSRVLQSDLGIYTADKQLLVDYVGRYESLEEDLGYVEAVLKLPARLTPLPRAKTDYRKDRRHYREVLQPAQRERIEEFFKAEIRMFDYKW